MTIFRAPTKFDSSEYIFIGEIIDIIGPYEGNNPWYAYYGYLVRIKKKIFLPEIPNKYFEIIPFGLAPDGGLSPQSKSTLNEEFPIGSEIRIVAKKAKLVKNNIGSDNIRLEISPFNNFTLTLNFPNIKELNSTKDSEYDYSRIPDNIRSKSKFCETLKSKHKIDLIMYDISCVFQFHFELRKDLYRLHHLKDVKKKIKIIDRLSEYYGFSGLSETINNYIEYPKQRKKLLSKYKNKYMRLGR